MTNDPARSISRRNRRNPAPQGWAGVMFASLLAALLSTLSGCAHPPPASPPSAAVFDDSRFAPPSHPVSRAQADGVDEALQRFIDEHLRPQPGDRRDARQRFVDILTDAAGLRLVYDDQPTRGAAEAFAQRRGNCLSLALMTAAVARELGIPVRFYQVQVDEVWTRAHGYTFASGHVHVSLAASPRPLAALPRGVDAWTVDFLPPEALRGLPRREIEPHTVLAMFFNNRAAELLSAGRLDDAYAHLRVAVRHDPGFAAAYNTLGIVWQRHGDDASARAAYEQALAIDAGNLKFIGNLLPLLNRPQDALRAAVLAARLEEGLPRQPFHWYDQGMAALRRGDPAAAIPLLQREIRRDPDHPEFHYRLAEAHAALGQLEAMRRHLQRAAEASTRPADAARYGAKIAELKRHMNLR
jgi:Tfp pilus assembly protein PilF